MNKALLAAAEKLVRDILSPQKLSKRELRSTAIRVARAVTLPAPPSQQSADDGSIPPDA